MIKINTEEYKMKLKKEQGINEYLKIKKIINELNKLSKEDLIERYMYMIDISFLYGGAFALGLCLFVILFIKILIFLTLM